MARRSCRLDERRAEWYFESRVENATGRVKHFARME